MNDYEMTPFQNSPRMDQSDGLTGAFPQQGPGQQVWQQQQQLHNVMRATPPGTPQQGFGSHNSWNMAVDGTAMYPPVSSASGGDRSGGGPPSHDFVRQRLAGHVNHRQQQQQQQLQPNSTIATIQPMSYNEPYGQQPPVKAQESRTSISMSNSQNIPSTVRPRHSIANGDGNFY